MRSQTFNFKPHFYQMSSLRKALRKRPLDNCQRKCHLLWTETDKKIRNNGEKPLLLQRVASEVLTFSRVLLTTCKSGAWGWGEGVEGGGGGWRCRDTVGQKYNFLSLYPNIFSTHYFSLGIQCFLSATQYFLSALKYFLTAHIIFS